VAGCKGKQQDVEIPKDNGKENVNSSLDSMQEFTHRIFSLPELLPGIEIRG